MWSKELVQILLEEYKTHENLYNVRHPDYMNRIKRSKSLQKIYERLKEYCTNITAELIKKKIHTLRSQYIKETRDIENSKGSADGLEEEYVPKLWCYDQLEFLKSHCSRKSITNTNGVSDDTMNDEAENNSVQCSSTSATLTSARKKMKLNSNVENSLKDIHEMLSHTLNEKQKYDWLGRQVVQQMNEIKDERRKRDTAWKIQSLLHEALEADSVPTDEPILYEYIIRKRKMKSK